MSIRSNWVRLQFGSLPVSGLLLAAIMCLGLPSVARAEWREASSAHFVVYADESEGEIREFAEDLERFHSALRVLSNVADEKPSPSNRLTVYVLGGESRVRKLYGDTNSFVSGFYIPRAGGSTAFVPRVDEGKRQLGDAMRVLLHEYSHHFFISNSSFPMPRWMSEGSAEFFGTASFEPDGALTVGMPANHRMYELHLMREVPLAELFDDELYRNRSSQLYDSYYGWSWLLYHYLMFAPERRGQIEEYVRYLVEGVPAPEAAVQAFGDLRELEKELNRYSRERRINSLRLASNALTVGQVDVRTLREGEAKVMPLRIRSKRGVTREQAAELLPDVREVAVAYPGDPAVQAALAEAEFDAGNYAEAVAAADAALAADSTNVDAYVQKGYALFRMAESAEDKDAAYKAAMLPFFALNRLENDHPLPLLHNFLSYLQRGKRPDELAVQGLQRAVELARFDLGLRQTLALQQIRDGEYEQAKGNLAPIAYDPHGGGRMSETAQKLIARLDQETVVSEAELTTLISAEDETEAEGGSGGGETASSD